MSLVWGIVLVLGLMILVHEWGHFIVARMFGVRVDVFSIGFGPRLFGWKRGATDYRVSLLPLGGYVRMAGQDPTEIDSVDRWSAGQSDGTKAAEKVSDATRATAESRGVDQTLRAGPGGPEALMSTPRWPRALSSFAGPAVNLIFPIFMLTGLYAAVGIPYQAWLDQHVQIIGMPAAHENAFQVGDRVLSIGAVHMQVGDKVVSIAGVQNPTWEQALTTLRQTPAGGTLKVEVERDGSRQTVDLPVTEGMKWEKVFGYSPVKAVLDQVGHGAPAERAGLHPGDAIVGVDGKKITYWDEFVDLVKGSDGRTLQVDVMRNGQPLHLAVTPQSGPNPAGETVYQIGVSAQEATAYKRVSFSEGVKESFAMTTDRTQETVGVVGMLVSGRVSVKQLQGAVGITRAAGEAVRRGPIDVIFLMVLISVNLGVLNLLPIPILDGGNILLLAIEGALRRDLSMSFKERFVQVGLVFLLVLFAVVMYNDVARWITSHS